jgi:hypothetical protein
MLKEQVYHREYCKIVTVNSLSASTLLAATAALLSLTL